MIAAGSSLVLFFGTALAVFSGLRIACADPFRLKYAFLTALAVLFMARLVPDALPSAILAWLGAAIFSYVFVLEATLLALKQSAPAQGTYSPTVFMLIGIALAAGAVSSGSPGLALAGAAGLMSGAAILAALNKIRAPRTDPEDR